MSSTTPLPADGKSQYGALDAVQSPATPPPSTDPNVNDNHRQPETIASQPVSPTPPRPAVRKRAQKAMQQDDSSEANSHDHQHHQIAMAAQDEIVQPVKFEHPDELNRELVELNRSIANRAEHPSNKSAPSKRMLSLPSAPVGRADNPQRAYPKHVLFIVGNEFCERFSYYGLRTVLILYFKSVFGFSDSSSTVSFHLFATLCYLTPVLGAILGDSVWGKFHTILYLSIVYFVGELMLVLSSIFWDSGLSAIITFAGLLLIGIGTGGIKPCVSALGGDQFQAHEDKWRQTFFSLFYGAINLGSLISMFVTPILRSDVHCVNRSDCYPLAFGLPCALMFMGIVVFLLAQNQYTLVDLPKRNVLLDFCRCIWLALKRKIGGHKLPSKTNTQHIQILSGETSSSSLSVSSNEEVAVAVKTATKSEDRRRPQADQEEEDRNHWLYLASDQFDAKSIGEFRSVLGILLIFLPIPVYWCLYDQQGSLWTLQATRMDGRVFNTNLIIHPDQMGVANPLLLLASIPVFEVFIYPSFNKCNVLTRPLSRMTVGGLLAALTFIVSAMIELRIQQFVPPAAPRVGHAHLLLVNGLNGCSVVNSTISPVQIPGAQPALLTVPASLQSEGSLQPLDMIKPLSFRSVEMFVANDSSNSINSYQIKFKLSSTQGGSLGASNSSTARLGVSCPLDPSTVHEFSLSPPKEQSVSLLYMEQGNGKLTSKMFNESLELPEPSKARVRLLYEFFGSVAQSTKRQFSLVRSSSSGKSKVPPTLVFQPGVRDGQVLLSAYLDVEVSGKELFYLRTNDSLLDSQSHHSITLESGTRNLIIVHQTDANSVEVRQELLQDNKYRISILYQLIPYLLISISEVMLSITGLEFSYSMAPDSMKSVILGAWSLTTAFGNILTVVVESLHIFPSVVHDFLFYATIMIVDMAILAVLSVYYKSPRERIPSAGRERGRNRRLDRSRDRKSSQSSVVT